jgi:transaldolase
MEMKFILDTANLDELKQGAAWGIVDGVTSAEVVSTTTKEMLPEGRKPAKIHKNVVVKLPLTRDGIKACSALSKEGIRVNVTLCFSAGRALLAANHPLTDKGLDQFLKDYRKVFHEQPAG